MNTKITLLGRIKSIASVTAKELIYRLQDRLGFEDAVVHEGRVEIFEIDDHGNEQKIVDTTNLVVDVGLNALRDGMQESSESVQVENFVLGTDGTAESAGDTSLGTQVHEEAFDGYSDTSTGESRWTGLVDSVEPSGQPYEIKEFGVKLSDGTLWSRVTFTGETKDTTQEWRVRYTSTWQNA